MKYTTNDLKNKIKELAEESKEGQYAFVFDEEEFTRIFNETNKEYVDEQSKQRDDK